MQKQVKQTPLTKTIIWQGRNIHLSYCPEYFKDIAHLEIRAEDGEPLPITETGYKSHFFMTQCPPCLQDIISFVIDWMNEEAKSKCWQEYCESSKQLSLF